MPLPFCFSLIFISSCVCCSNFKLIFDSPDNFSSDLNVREMNKIIVVRVHGDTVRRQHMSSTVVVNVLENNHISRW